MLLIMVQHTSAGRELTALILEVFQSNGALLAAGDELVGDLGLTSARWQVLGALALEGRPLTVAQIGRRMGLSRQAVQRVVNDLVADDVLAFENNPDHRRAKLVALTERGQAVYSQADARQIDWVNELGKGISPQDLQNVRELLALIGQRLKRTSDKWEG
ncbi:MAG: MarR family transcriptional regulator [Pseudomonadota bacterium]